MMRHVVLSAVLAGTVLVGVDRSSISPPVSAATPRFQPELIADLEMARNESSPADVFVVDDVTYFSAVDGFHGTELWKHDHRTGTTSMVVDANPGTGDGNPRPLLAVNGDLWFTVRVNDDDTELWSTDGTAAGSGRAADIGTAFDAGSPDNGFVLGGRPHFTAYDRSGDFDQQIYRVEADGSVTKRTSINVAGSADFGESTIVSDAAGDDVALFRANGGGSLGIEMYALGETGAEVRHDISPNPDSTRPHDFVEVGGEVWFEARDGGNGLYFAVVTSASSVQWQQYRPDLGNLDDDFAVSGDDVYFAAEEKLWVTDDPTAAPTLLIDRSGGYVEYLVGYGKGVLFTAESQSGDDRALWRTDGTPSGTEPVFAGDPNAPIVEIDDEFAVDLGDGSTVLFPAAGLWRTDGTAAGTEQIAADLRVDRILAVADRRFTVLDQSNPRALYVTDDDGENITRIDNGINTTTADSFPRAAFEFQGHVHLDTNLGVFRHTPGSPPELLTQTVPSVDFRSIRVGAVTDTQVFLRVDPVSGGNELRVWDGSSNNAEVVFTSPNSLSPIARATDGDLVYLEFDGTLWRSDGTVAGTFQIADGYDRSAVAVGADGVVFENSDSAARDEPWTTDGTVAGTRLLADLAPGTTSSRPGSFVAFDGDVFFTADPGSGRQMYVSENGTGVPTPVGPLPDGGIVTRLEVAGDRLFSFTDNGGRGEVWSQSAGQAPVQLDVSDVAPEARLDDVVVVDDVMFVTARTNGQPAGVLIIDGDSTVLVAAPGGQRFVDTTPALDGVVATFRASEFDDVLVFIAPDGTTNTIDTASVAADESFTSPRAFGGELVFAKTTLELGSEPYRASLVDPPMPPEPEPDGPDVVSLLPSRVLESRAGQDTADGLFELGRRLAGGEVLPLDVLGRGGVPADGVGSVILNATMINPDGGGYVAVFPCRAGDPPLASSVNAPRAGGAVANEVIVKLGTDDRVCVFTSVGTHVAVDVTGWVAA